VQEANEKVLADLKERGLLFAAVPFTHNYPFCWRCDTPLIYYARSGWFIRMTALHDELMKNNRTLNWMPENIKEGRFGNFLDNVVDWGISRERYWGTPLPIWECGCGHRHAIGSIEELKQLSDDCPDEIELHKPYIDQVHIRCSECGGQMKRVSEVIDCWFDSGSMPFAQWHYPFENKEIFEENFPADFISEALDQTRGWFYTLMAIGTLIFDKSPYENVIVLGLVQDKNGQKMSKHKGNVVDPWEVLDKQGADAVRWYFYTNSAPWLPSRFYADAVSEAQRKFMGTLWNTYAFYVLYANIDGFNPTKYELKTDTLCVMDRWILSRLNSLVDSVDHQLEKYEITSSARAIQQFTDDLSNWYVRRGRERYWQSDMNQDKIDAYMTLYTVLETLTRLSAVYIPFMADAIYRNLVLSHDNQRPGSVHLCDFPTADLSLVDKELERNMDEVLRLVVMGRAARNTSAIKNRQPLARMLVVSKHQLPAEFQQLVREELNVRAIEYTDDQTSLQDYSFKPQLKTLGKRLGKLIPKVSAVLAELPGQETIRILRENGKLNLSVEGQKIELAEEDLLIETIQAEGLAAESDRDVTVALDTKLTPELIEDGFVREIISKVQTMRKESGFEVMDRIILSLGNQEVLTPVVQKHRAYICDEVLADELIQLAEGADAKEWDINGEKLKIAVRKV
jgi:isoleucyl-tRNA synthetase